MKKQPIEEALKQHKSLRPAAKSLEISYTTLRYWIKKHNITYTPRRQLKKHECQTCGETNNEEFYGKQKTQCKTCTNKQSMDKWKSLKLKAIEYKGGQCMNCNYVKFYGALEFHHRDPKAKEYNWVALRLRGWTDIKKELDKCDLLCANCHREEHHRLLL